MNWYDFLWQSNIPNWMTISGWAIASVVAWRTLRSLNQQVKANIVAADAARDAAKTAEQTFLFGLRPKLIIRDLRLINKLDDFTDVTIDPQEAVFIVVNQGSTSAEILSGNVTIQFAHIANPEFMQGNVVSYEGPDDALRRITLDAGIEQLCTVRHPPIKDDLEIILELNTGTLTMYVLGYFSYRDRIGRRYKTAFCRRYEKAPKRRFVAVEDADFEYAD